MVSSSTFYLILLALIGGERLFELALSRRNARIAFAHGGREFGHRHFRVMALLHLLFLVSCAAEVVYLDRPFQLPLGVSMLVIELLAQGLRYWAVATLGERWNVRIIVVPGAMPVTAGPYRFVRHPNYVAVVIEIAALPLIHGAYLTAILFSLLNVAMLVVRIRAEERAMGEVYAATFKDRPRFLPVK
jgi:methyltransferase